MDRQVITVAVEADQRTIIRVSACSCGAEATEERER